MDAAFTSLADNPELTEFLACRVPGSWYERECGAVGALGPELELLLPELDEKARRLTLGAVARAAGDGGIGAVAKMTGVSWQTVANGAAELDTGQVAPAGRVRRAGRGPQEARRDRSGAGAGAAGAGGGLGPGGSGVAAAVDDQERGEPGRRADRGRGTACSPQTAWRLLREQGFSTQANAKVAEGRRHPDRDAQFRYIAAQAREHLAAGQPVISVDAKKKEQVGEYAQAGREWRPKGDPVKVRDHCFADRGRRAGDPVRDLRRGREHRVRQRGHRPQHRGARGGVDPPLVGPGRQGRLPGRGPAAGLLRRRRVQRLAEPGLEGRARRAGAGDRAGDHRAATSRPAPPSGTRSSTGCSPRSPWPGAAAR